MSANHTAPDYAAELFVLDASVAGGRPLFRTSELLAFCGFSP